MTTVGATWQHKLDSLTRGLEWASGVCGAWAFQADAFQAPDHNDPWFELRMGRITRLGQDEVCSVDNIDPSTGLPDVTNPRAEIAVGQREFIAQLRVYGRDQEHDTVAWAIAEKCRTRMHLDYFNTTFLRIPFIDGAANAMDPQLAIVDLFDVVAMPKPEQVISNRWQSEAVLEMRMSTKVAETDGAAIGTWIEKVQLTSDNLLQCGGDPLDASLQIDTLIDAS
jgi:hypothetical protein